MIKEKLIEMLRSLPIHKPEVDQVRNLFPHLSLGEIKEVLTVGEEGDPNYFAVPSLKVHGAFQIVSFGSDYENEPVTLSWTRAGRTRESYVDGRNYRDISCRHMDKAIAFARDNWESDLILDDWVDFVKIYVQDPSDLHESGFSKGCPKTKATVGCTTTKSWHDIINDHSKPQSQVIDDAISHITSDYLIANELQGSTRVGSTLFNCAYDGAGLGVSGCGECGNRFSEDIFSRSGWNTPLPSKITDYLIAQGFEFIQDPTVAREKEANRFVQHARK